MKDFVRVFGAFPIARTDAGDIVADHDVRFAARTHAACLAAEQMARKHPYVPGVAFTRTIDLIVGELLKG